MKNKAYIVNAFTEKLAGGNQAGVVLTEDFLPEHTMQDIACDIGKAETAFIVRKDGIFHIRWFSPLKEMPLCGHGTLSAAAVISETYGLTDISFKYGRGTITAEVDSERNIRMTFPMDDYEGVELKPEYLRFFHLTPDDYEECILGRSTGKVIIILKNQTDICGIKPEYELMKAYSGIGDNGIGLSKLSDEYDFETRYFNPWAGVNEDNVTGSVHTVLANYWRKRLDKIRLTAIQLSSRPGIIGMEILNENELIIQGKARIVLAGEIILPEKRDKEYESDV